MLAVKINEIRSFLQSSKDLKILERLTHELFQIIISEPSSAVDSELTGITRLIQDVCTKNHQISLIFLSYLQIIQEVGPFIDLIPSIFSVSSDYQIDDAFATLVSLIESDNRNTLRVLSALIDLPLLPHLQSQLSTLAIDALASVEECDVPSLCRTILKNLNTVDALAITQEIRNQVHSFSVCCLCLRLFLSLLTSLSVCLSLSLRSAHSTFQIFL
jgi:hypothetical protein